ncbi:hypothetical protein HZF05_03245 [Sphingomonas sp. CGMCC 1.13654]|uniref:Uncharacterized protein n=1 Tax=Sphingomonas chungangi TaxID=2683589 RepID=A0A838L4G7_9SPHN|nr:hypothetical protein [Sphingomonas chungangi]MBA2933106.1 hypothetical protein [Sphingomonas chungangi]MVW56726.1 hypothetical protein [Sphingomonas chungangi]
MSWWALYQELKGWQSGIGSILGFGGLIAGALFNARLNRKRDNRLRDIEAITIALSLYGEIKLLRENVAAIASGLGAWFIIRGAYGNDLPDHYREIYPVREPTLYNALASKLGMLNPDLLLPITKFYSDYEAAVGHFPKLFNNEGRTISYGPEWVIEPAVRAVEDIEAGLRRIERLGAIQTPASIPSTGRAKEALRLVEDLRPDPE